MTITPYLKKRLSSDNYGIINIRVTNNRKSEYISLKISIQERFWNPKRKEVRSTHPESEELNQKIQDEIDNLKKERDIKDSKEIKKNVKKSFLEYFQSYLIRLQKQGKFGSYKKYNTTYLHLTEYKKENNKSDILFSEIDFNWIESFEEYLILKNLKTNTRNNYLKCCQRLFLLSVKEKVYRTIENPFLSFSFKRKPVEKRRLSIRQVQTMISSDVEFGSLTYETRVKFLIQIYGQGLRVSDLFTLRFKNIDFDGHLSRINFFQYKTKKRHSIQLSYELLRQIFYFYDKELYREMYYTRKYSFIWKEKEYSWTLPHIEKELRRLRDISLKEGKDHWNILGTKVYTILGDLFIEQLNKLKEYSMNNPNKFIIPWLNERYYEDVEFNDSTVLTKKQYNHLQSRITVYNRNLKRLEPLTGTIIRITSHTPRHTYTNLLLGENTDVYSISKSLGHSKLSITENYLNDFDKDKVDDDNTEMFRKMNLTRMILPPTKS